MVFDVVAKVCKHTVELTRVTVGTGRMGIAGSNCTIRIAGSVAKPMEASKVQVCLLVVFAQSEAD